MTERTFTQKSEDEWKVLIDVARNNINTPRPNILICGYTGSGKTSLIKAILGDVVPPDAIGSGKPMTQGFDYYENNLVRVYDSKGMENGDTEEEFLKITKEFIHDHLKDPNNPDEFIHLVWYTIQGPGARVTDCDKVLIKDIFTPKNMIVCITKSDIMRGNQKNEMVKVLKEAGVPEKRIIFTSDEEGGSIGINELMKLSLEILPDAYKSAFEEAQTIDKERRIEAVKKKAKKAKWIIGTAATAAGGIGFTPIPCSDAPLLVTDQTTMIASLAALYGIGFDTVKVGMLPFLAKLAGTALASSLLKFIPGLGTIAGGAITAAIATSLTGAMGWYVQNYFEKCAIAKIEGKPMPEMPWDAEMFKKFYEQFKNDKNAAKA